MRLQVLNQRVAHLAVEENIHGPLDEDLHHHGLGRFLVPTELLGVGADRSARLQRPNNDPDDSTDRPHLVLLVHVRESALSLALLHQVRRQKGHGLLAEQPWALPTLSIYRETS